MPFRFLRCLAQAVARHGGKFLVRLIPGGVGEVVYEMVADAWQSYQHENDSADLRGEIENLAQATPAQVRRQVEEVLAAEAVPLSAEQRQAAAAYLAQVPALIRRELRRPSDPGGTTVPLQMVLDRPESLLPFLPPQPPRFKPGDHPFPGCDWVLEELLGMGGFGEVWKARQLHAEENEPRHAFKFCLGDAAQKALVTARKALENEVGVLRRLKKHGSHPGIVNLIEPHLTADPPCLEYEFVPGCDLTSWIRELHATGKPDVNVVNQRFLKLVEIVAFAHQAGIVHDDLKPANILVSGTQDDPSLHITDFGIGGVTTVVAAQESRQPTRSRQLLTEAVRGAYTPLYAPQEQMLRKPGEPVDPRDDVHALGVIWFQMLTNNLTMFSVPTDWFQQVKKCGLSAALIPVLGACFAPEAGKRPKNAGALARLLKERLEKRPQEDEEEERKRQQREREQAEQRRREEEEARRQRTQREKEERERAERLRQEEQKRREPVGLAPAPSPALWSRRALVGGIALGVGGLSCMGVVSMMWSPRSERPKGNPQPPSKPGAVSTNTLGMKFAHIPAGSFWMGGGGGTPGEKQVPIPHGFFLGVYEVTQKEWRLVMKDTEIADPSRFKGDDLPVEQVSWKDTQEFIKRLNERERGSGWVYRLPTEAEWEYSCRGGASSKEECSFHFYFKTPTNDLSWDQACFDGSRPFGNGKKGAERTSTTKVGSFEANRLRLHDMHGNVWEWTSSQEGSGRVIRGGSWRYFAARCAAAARDGYDPGYRDYDLGFRLLAVPSV
jgi:formylglycine-generating enzyme required for sulfatase activity